MKLGLAQSVSATLKIMNETINPQETAQTPVTNQESSPPQEVTQEVQAEPSQGKSKVGVFLAVFLIILITAAGAAYYFLLYPRQQLQKARTPDETVKTDSGILPPTKKVENKGLNSKIVIEPSKNDVISGTVNIKAENVLENTKHVGFTIIENVDEYGQGGPNLGFDSDSSDGWSKELDTSTYKNGEYYIVIFVFDNDASSDPTGVSNVKVLINN
ncbi:hypothetical protein ACFL1M_03190 [Patescibacteria group bacterium]